MPGKILVVDDEPAIRAMVRFALKQADFRCAEAQDAAEAQTCVLADLPDLILLDWMLPGLNGVDYARRLRRERLTQNIPIIMLTARVDEEDKVRALNTGADDFMTKPFSPRELIARVRAVLRRVAPMASDDIVAIGGLLLDPATHKVLADDERLTLGPTEFRLLHFFMTHAERVHSRERVLDAVWGSNTYIDERTVDVHIRRLRKALTASGYDRYIQTVRGVGYRFSGDS
ncbi:phosphate regulon transcriptional regulator PhoB [Acidiferrobacter sp.]|uniref:phosphate regulon transcriptional regulator PhoB n=2 Tax=Acidiferrobacter sp. TaxID=1872107 RepID=UPI00263321F4|nr:phosphate regulon transcriptional regulator PhoB [Acidiferrobacter sp.]